MTTMITTLGKDYSVKALATDVGGKLFVRCNYCDGNIQLGHHRRRGRLFFC